MFKLIITISVFVAMFVTVMAMADEIRRNLHLRRLHKMLSAGDPSKRM